MNGIFGIAALVALLFAAPAVAQPATLKLSEVEPLVKAGRAMDLADLVLPAEIRARIVRGQARRVYVPGQYYWMAFREPARIAGSDMCERDVHSVVASAPYAPTAPGGDAPADTILTLGEMKSWAEVAVLPPSMRAEPAACEAASYIAILHDPARRIAAYRVLVSAMAAARRDAPLPFALSCKSEKPEACADARSALAGLPMDALSGISVSCVESERIRESREEGIMIASCPALRAKQPYRAEVAFGMSGPDGQSWRVAFIHSPGWPAEITLQRSMVFYH